MSSIYHDMHMSGVYHNIISEYSKSQYNIDSLLLLIMSANTNCHM